MTKGEETQRLERSENRNSEAVHWKGRKDNGRVHNLLYIFGREGRTGKIEIE